MKTIPGYVRYFIILSSITLTFYLLILGRSIISPLVAAFVAALLLRPLSAWIERAKIHRGLSSVLSIIVVLGAIFGLFWFFSSQVNNIVKDLKSIGERFNELIDRMYLWMEQTFGVEQQEQVAYLKDSLNTFLENSASTITATVSATAGFFTGFFMFLLALFFLLYYRRFFVAFLYQIAPAEKENLLGTTIAKIEEVVRSYVLGLLTVIVIVAILNTIGLMALGIQHAIFFGVLAAVLTIIPYIGIFIGSLLPILFALITKDSLWYPIGVAILFWVVQIIEGNFITPNIVGGKVSVNPFAAIIGLFLGGMLWGAIGMILSIPLLAITKVICDAIPSFHAIGFLLGEPPGENSFKRKKGSFKRIFKKQSG